MRGDGYINDSGYKIIHKPGYPSVDKKNRIREHIYVMEQHLGHLLPKGSVVHHINGVRTDNRIENLVLCESKSSHRILHAQLEALNACGHENWLKCCYCHKYDDPKNLFVRVHKICGTGSSYHTKCNAEYRLGRYHEVWKHRAPNL
jgi:hypothetical protein